MTASPASALPSTLSPAAVVDEFLRLLMIPDPAAARRFMAAGLRIRFTGRKLMLDPSECAAFNADRYRRVKKRIEATGAVAGGSDAATVVCSTGTLYGEWPNGVAFEGNRYVDRYVVSHGLITQMEVWKDSAEWLMVRAGMVEACTACRAAPVPAGRRTARHLRLNRRPA